MVTGNGRWLVRKVAQRIDGDDSLTLGSRVVVPGGLDGQAVVSEDPTQDQPGDLHRALERARLGAEDDDVGALGREVVVLSRPVRLENERDVLPVGTDDAHAGGLLLEKVVGLRLGGRVAVTVAQVAGSKNGVIEARRPLKGLGLRLVVGAPRFVAGDDS